MFRVGDASDALGKIHNVARQYTLTTFYLYRDRSKLAGSANSEGGVEPVGPASYCFLSLVFWSFLHYVVFDVRVWSEFEWPPILSRVFSFVVFLPMHTLFISALMLIAFLVVSAVIVPSFLRVGWERFISSFCYMYGGIILPLSTLVFVVGSIAVLFKTQVIFLLLLIVLATTMYFSVSIISGLLSDGKFGRLRKIFGVIFLILGFGILMGTVRDYSPAIPLKIIGDGMAPTLKSDDMVLVNRWLYQWRRPKRGEIVLFKGEGNVQGGASAGWHIKRIVGLPLEKVRMMDGVVYVNGRAFKLADCDGDVDVFDSVSENVKCESFYGAKYKIQENGMHPEIRTTKEVVLGVNEVFMLGDNRDNSLDSRTFGAVPIENISGKVYSVIKNGEIVSSRIE